ncbi:hypothetical protein FSP39_019570 [Pinctada imbricata]|uniref:BTB domain-containing protein n=1 Tax=Pinctada imbricata TaxID=66713 RepID=A0AA88YEU0_PINIB|nr:hypothetical protein FSP39_019570 [Pinctada imbricata]
MATPTVEWQCNKTLTECLLYMLEKEVACDVRFLFEKGTQEVRAHKVILLSRSPVFYSMLEGPLAEKGDITITDVTKESFVEFLRYLYSDVFEPNWETLIDVFYCSKKYCVDILSELCIDFLRNNVSTQNVCTVLGVSLCFDMKDIIVLCISLLEEDTKECLDTPGFLASSKECIEAILNLDKVNCREEDIYEGVLRWAGEECRRQEMEDTPANYRAVLGDQIYKIRFQTMGPYFSENISNSCILTDEEKVDIYRSMHLKKDSHLSKFISYPRIRQPFRVTRFKDISHPWVVEDTTDKISFEVSHGTKLRGVQVYGSSEEKRTIKYTIQIKDGNGKILHTETESISTDGSSATYDILLSKVIRLKRRERYTIEIDQKHCGGGELYMYYGINGQTSVRHSGDKSIIFYSAADSEHTNIDTGQIPGIIMA